jgi:MOB kinase activator 1
MSAGEKYTYLWKDAEGTNPKYKKPTEVSAPEYVLLLMEWIEQLINNADLFPSDVTKFKKTFPEYVKKIFNKLFRVYAHIYYSHFDELMELGLDRHLN